MPDNGIEPMLPVETSPPPAADDTLRLTYRELAERLGVSADGARALARRQQWPVGRDESGRSLVLVAAAALTQQRERRSEHDRTERTDTRAMAARVAEMVAALKAEVAPDRVTAPGIDAAEQARMHGLMRHFLDMYERERLDWANALNDINAQLDDAKAEACGLAEAQDRLVAAHQQERAELIEAHQWERAELIAAQDKLFETQQQERAELVAAREAAETALGEMRPGFDAQLSVARAAASAAEAKHQQALVQHKRALSDLAVIHNDQRSLWMLERRRLEGMVDALEQRRSSRWPAFRIRATAVLRAALAVLVVALASIVLARDTGPPRLSAARGEPGGFVHASQAGLGAGTTALPQTWPTR